MDHDKACFVLLIITIIGVLSFLFRMEGCERQDSLLKRENERRQIEMQAEAVKAAERVFMEWGKRWKHDSNLKIQRRWKQL